MTQEEADKLFPPDTEIRILSNLSLPMRHHNHRVRDFIGHIGRITLRTVARDEVICNVIFNDTSNPNGFVTLWILPEWFEVITPKVVIEEDYETAFRRKRDENLRAVFGAD